MSEINTAEPSAYTDPNQPVDRPAAEMPAPTEASVPQSAPQVEPLHDPNTPINIIGPDGEVAAVAPHELNQALSAGYRQATDEEVHSYVNDQKYGGFTEGLKAFGEGAGRGFAGPLSTLGEKAAGVNPEDILGREEAHPIASMAGEIGGFATSMLSGIGEGAIVTKLGAKGLAKLGMAGAESTAAKIGSAAVRGAIENTLVGASDETSKMILDPKHTVGAAAVNVGLSGLLGAGLGGSIEALNPLWKATIGKTLGGKLQAITDKVGGVEGVEPGSVEETIQRHFPDLAPEVRSALSTDPKIRSMVSTLSQSDTTSSGRAFQEATNNFRSQIQEHLVDALGKTPEQVRTMPEVNNYERGNLIGKTLADEYSSQIDPVAKEFEALKERAKNTPLEKDSSDAAGLMSGGVTKPGTGSQIADTIASLVSRESWAGSDDIMKEVNRVIKKLPTLDNLSDLTKLGTEIGNNTASTLPFGQQTPLSRAGGMMKSILRDAENDIVEKSLATKQLANAEVGKAIDPADDLVTRFKNARQAYSEQAKIKEALDDRLGVHGSISGFAKGLKEMARTDGEGIVRKLSGKNDADLLKLMQDKFPKTAELIKQYHLDNVLQKASDKATGDNLISPKILQKGVDSLDPNLKDFIFKPAVDGAPDPRTKIDAMNKVLERLNDPNHNFSNTARAADKLISHIPGSAVGLMSLITGHGVVASTLLGGLGKIMGKDAPDAIKLALLKFLGTNKEIQPGAFKAAVDYIQAAKKGDSAAKTAAKAVFDASKAVIPEHLIPTDKDRTTLDKTLRTYQQDPKKLQGSGTAVAHYMDDHGQQIAQTTAQATNYLNGIRPSEAKANPLDSAPVVTPSQKAAYNNALNIAQQPLLVLDKIKQGNITSQDIVHLQAMYPAMYTKLSQNLTENMMAVLHKGGQIPYKTKLGLSMFLNQPMDSTMAPASIIAAQPIPAQGGQDSSQNGQKPPSSSSTKDLSKLPNTYRTQSQTRAAERTQK